MGKKIPLHNNGTPIRNWLYAQDTANSIITLIESKVKNGIYNIAGGFEQTNLDTVKKVITLHEENKNLTIDDSYFDFSYSRAGQDVRYALNDDKLRNLGWEPKSIFDNELPNIVKYYKENFIW